MATLHAIMFVAVANMPFANTTAGNPPARCSMEALYQAGMAAVTSAEKEIAQNHFIEANAKLDEGLASLGSRYVSSSIVDDTGQKLTLARIEEREGRLQIAANLKKGVLSSRLEIYRRTLCKDIQE